MKTNRNICSQRRLLDQEHVPAAGNAEFIPPTAAALRWKRNEFRAPAYWATRLIKLLPWPFLLTGAMVFGLTTSVFGTYPNNVNDGDDELLSGLAQGGTLATWYVSEPYINLWLEAQPLTYSTSWGRLIGFQAAYKQRNTRSSTIIFGLGPYWESSWLSCVKYQANYGYVPPQITVGTTYVALGGERSYVADGITKEFKTDSTMTKLTDGNANLTGFRINYPSGGQGLYGYLSNVSSNENYALLS